MLMCVEISERKSYVSKTYIWNAATCSCENGKYLGSLTDYEIL